MELRLVLTVDDFDRALALYRDALGLEQMQVWEDGRVVLLDAGRATLELADEEHAATVDRIEVGRRVAGPVRIAFQVEDAEGVAQKLEAAGAVRIAGPVETPWRDLNVRLDAPDGLQLALFQPL
jgi:catechol 2,3-dioxygenase-like lactoylglutathione lyase family enzyme